MIKIATLVVVLLNTQGDVVNKRLEPMSSTEECIAVADAIKSAPVPNNQVLVVLCTEQPGRDI